MKKIISIAALGVLLAGCVHAQEPAPGDMAAASEGTAPLLGHFSFSTNNPGGVVSAMDSMMAACGDQMPAAVTLIAESFNGADPSTHTALFSYADAGGMLATNMAFQNCVSSTGFFATVNTITKPTGQYLGQTVLGRGDPSLDQVFQVYRMSVTNEGEYAPKLAAFMDAISDDLPGSYGLIRIVGGASQSSGSHYVYVGASDPGTLLASNEAIFATEAWAEYAEAVKDLRTTIDTRMSFRVKDYNMPDSSS